MNVFRSCFLGWGGEIFKGDILHPSSPKAPLTLESPFNFVIILSSLLKVSEYLMPLFSKDWDHKSLEDHQFLGAELLYNSVCHIVPHICQAQSVHNFSTSVFLGLFLPYSHTLLVFLYLSLSIPLLSLRFFPPFLSFHLRLFNLFNDNSPSPLSPPD